MAALAPRSGSGPRIALKRWKMATNAQSADARMMTSSEVASRRRGMDAEWICESTLRRGSASAS